MIRRSARKLAAAAAALFLSAAPGAAESNPDCVNNLLKCAQDTKVSALQFGLQRLADELQRLIERNRALGPDAALEISAFVMDGRPYLNLAAINADVTCAEFRSLVVYEIKAVRQAEFLLQSEKTLAQWKEPVYHDVVRRDACRNIASFLAPSTDEIRSDEAKLELCRQVTVDLLIAKIDVNAEPTQAKLQTCGKADIVPAE